AYAGFILELLDCAVKCLACSDNADLYFVGRSPESIYDLLSGILRGTSWTGRVHLLHFSMRYDEEAEVRREYPGAVEALRAYLCTLNLSPQQIIASEHGVAFSDIVASGSTLGNLVRILYHWCKDARCDWRAIKAKLRVVAIVEREKPTPHAWRWWQQDTATCVPLLWRQAITNIAVSGSFFHYLGAKQQKTTISYTPERWATGEASHPAHHTGHLEALRLALHIYETGRETPLRRAFAHQMAHERAMRYAWFRSLAHEIKG
ncbi:MAG TPA: hypothetical protein VKB76_02300, partial [Ktedonobacterales bacterium]|nr:hypothetical protein [Ktedonobacterales bacterium]